MSELKAILDYSFTCTYNSVFFFTVPSLSVAIQPSHAFATNVPPHNILTLRCIAAVSTGVNLMKNFEWQLDDSILSDDGNSVLISSQNLENALSTSEVTDIGKPIGSYMYNCTVAMQVPGGLHLRTSATATAIVRGEGYIIIISF